MWRNKFIACVALFQIELVCDCSMYDYMTLVQYFCFLWLAKKPNLQTIYSAVIENMVKIMKHTNPLNNSRYWQKSENHLVSMLWTEKKNQAQMGIAWKEQS